MYENYRVLFVDDEPNILNSLRRSLMDEEYYCLFASSGMEALDILKKDHAAVIVTDMRMPEMSGLELLTRISEEYPAIVKIVLSGYTQLPQILATINQVDIFKFITKPWATDDFIQAVRKALDYYILREENEKYKAVLEAKNISYQNILKKINEVVDDAKKSKELLGLCGKAIVGFGKDFSIDEKEEFQHIFLLREALFDLLTNKTTIQRKEMAADKLASYFTDYIRNLYPDSIVKNEIAAKEKISVNLKMLEAAIDMIWLIFAGEFQSNGFYCRISQEEPLTITILSPHAATMAPNQPANGKTELDVKTELLQTVMKEALELCQIMLKIRKVEDSLVAELTLLNPVTGLA